MNLASICASMQSTADAVRAAVDGVDDALAHWKPDPDTWSIVEIVTHLADEEVEDFRTRVQLTLEDPSQDWPPIDPQGAAVEREYNTRPLQESLERFLAARAESLAWLRSLEASAIDWSVHKAHPLGDLRAGDILASWAAHDLLHLRQITKRRFEWLGRQVAPYSTAYAGSW